MTIRSQTPQAGLVPAPLSKSNPPYPLTPAEEHLPTIPSTSGNNAHAPNHNPSPAFNFITPEEANGPKDTRDDVSDYSDDEDWDRSDDDDDFEDIDHKYVPDALKPAKGKSPQDVTTTNSTNRSSGIPDALRAGPPAGVPIKKSFESMSSMPAGANAASWGSVSNISELSNGSVPLQTNNPYLKMQATGQSNFGADNSQSVWGESSQQAWGGSQAHPQVRNDPVELPAHDFAKLKLDSHAPLQSNLKSSGLPPTIAVESATPQHEHFGQNSTVSDPWNQPTSAPSAESTQTSHVPVQHSQPTDQNVWQDQQHWGTGGQEAKQLQELNAAQEVVAKAEQQQEREYVPSHVHEQAPPYTAPQSPSPHTGDQPPTLPPRRSHEDQQLPSLETGVVGAASNSVPESPTTAMNRQRKENYQIKQIRWHDVNKQGIRTSPILTQNLNGPCPLLALVNALVLSTPSGVETALTETLRTRETVSLGLLLDAVFDELMSGRRGEAAQGLPDVSDLYKFLLALHTGLNVNPLFVPETDGSPDNTALTNRSTGQGGGFENTHDMRLYRTFDIPLMHGWLPEAGSEAYSAFDRVAKSYETSQYVQFQEEELDAKLQSGEPLTASEQQMFTDIHAIKEFLDRWPTQLTDYGLKVMRDGIQPGQVAILFRNDHFSTVFKDPRTNHLVTLVTDQGYSSHDEIVWESLVDVNGQGSELYSGDFRPVGNSAAPPQPQERQQIENVLHVDDNQDWTTVQSRRGNQQQTSSTPNANLQNSELPSPMERSRAEQEDHDLALALQLQEEEDESRRRDTEQRQRENQLSENAIAEQSQARPGNRRTSRGEAPPVIPPRRNNQTTFRPSNEPAPPPTYEEASTIPQYHPPQGHPANPAAPLTPQGSAYQSNSMPSSGRRHSGRPQAVPNTSPGRIGRRHSGGPGQIGNGNGNGNGHEERDKCVVM
ncbi:hypothetical protein P153DRAFT_367526 [Dothidotthia symphoricarpi CBS 119687]|uniref:MINDY deubiquitinase domain-containing protein n=1 Tax=Dothidotthia symphoricarpi CBS 119687 TaxID=1392245 RepID=A0A6A6ABI5_9PLEO|nr:uncharacterized protein P153DRAFT_367526 [Dothidotthia symphoricarpi CBS 119687]KAF2128374.1 hypothetical protein P153DRAFT_367526 [Dothidotthia symphoricarpi CBS 119687]